METIRLPAGSGVRSRKAYLKLLARVDPDAENGFGFEGSLLRPGAWVTRAELRPAPNYPEIPVLLEYSMAPSHASGAGRRSDGLYVLWRWSGDANDWRELGRSCSAAWEWALDLRPLAIRALAQESAIQCDMGLIAREITTFLDAKLHILAPPDRVRLLGILHDQFASRLSA
jgi:hypothetical protein